MSRIVEELMGAGVPLEAVERLLGQWGGLPLYIPQTVDPSHAIARIAGVACMAVLVQGWAGLRITLPLGRALIRARSVRQVAELKAAGLSCPEIARRLGLHVRQVQRLSQGRAALPDVAESPQLALALPGAA
jgi:hypothetical protein